MTIETMSVFWPFFVSALILFIVGIYCLLVTINLIRALIGVELMIKAVTLLIVTIGYITDHIALTQAFIITMIVIEVVFITVAMGIVIGLVDHNGSLDARNLRNLKG